MREGVASRPRSLTISERPLGSRVRSGLRSCCTLLSEPFVPRSLGSGDATPAEVALEQEAPSRQGLGGKGFDLSERTAIPEARPTRSAFSPAWPFWLEIGGLAVDPSEALQASSKVACSAKASWRHCALSLFGNLKQLSRACCTT